MLLKKQLSQKIKLICLSIKSEMVRNIGKDLLEVVALKHEMSTFKIAGILLNMELKGVVKHLHGKLFEVV